MQYGYFDDAKREYVITNPKTPVKWINYVGSLTFGGFLDHTGGSQICKGDPALNRITKYIPQLPSADFKGETAYVRVRKPGQTAQEATVISPYWHPCLGSYDQFECHVGMYYTRWITEIAGLRHEVLAFVPIGGKELLRRYTVTNLRDEPVFIELIPVVEFTHFDALKQLTNADWVPQTMTSLGISLPDGRTAIGAYAFMKREYAVNVLTASRPATAYETDRKRFVGDNEYGTWANPLSLKAEKLSSKDSVRGDTIAALQIELGNLVPGASASVITQLFQTGALSNVASACGNYVSDKEVEDAFNDLTAYWDRYLSVIKVETPDAAFNSMLNLHNPRQCYTTKTWSRYLSLYQLGYGSDRGIGFRDSSQDTMGVIAQIPDEARELMEKLLSVQSIDGSGYHQFNPLTMVAGRGDSMEYEDRPHFYSDDHLWIILAVNAYIKETGDYGFLDKIIPFYEKDKSDMPLESGTVFEHMRRGVAFTHEQVGQHGLPLLGFADWNDTVNLPTGSESMFTANLYGCALRELSDLCDYLSTHTVNGLNENLSENSTENRTENRTENIIENSIENSTENNIENSTKNNIENSTENSTENKSNAKENIDNHSVTNNRMMIDECTSMKPVFDSWYQDMKTTYNAVAWDGEWYSRYFDEKGNVIGSIQNDFGKLWLNGQSWAVLSGFAEGTNRGRLAMDAVKTYLATEKGIKLSWPGYNGFDPQKGGVTTYPPGAKENGGIFLHPNPWAIIAETALGDGDQAFSYYARINPAAKNNEIDEYECEPYCYAQNILADVHPNFGLGRNSWLSGTASWMYQASTKYILGIRPEHKGLLFDPCIPKDWNEFTVERICRGVTYQITLKNPDKNSKGIKRMVVDGQNIEGNCIPWFKEGVHQVEAIM